jgi:ribulose-phosphate 3-epimerase
MVSRPDQWINDMGDAGTDAFTFHIETSADGVDIEGTINAVKAAGMKVGLALKPGTAVELVFPFVEMLDQVLVMTVEPVRSLCLSNCPYCTIPSHTCLFCVI